MEGIVKHPIQQMIEARSGGNKIGIYSACTASEQVLEAVIAGGKACDAPVLIEATANQCNQDGGYTGMTPVDYVRFIHRMAESVGYDPSALILGGDHLGPLTWSKEPERPAMDKACELVRQYVAAGFTKIHLDTSMHLLDDDRGSPLPDEVIAERAAKLAQICEQEAAKTKNCPVYVIGSEVPIPGGAQQEEDGVAVTTSGDFEATYWAFREAFRAKGLEDAFSRVVGVVVQPGWSLGTMWC
jgi:D-tagatose-1,6-bisphosphate aldolase subunit GatZ/KbaZ